MSQESLNRRDVAPRDNFRNGLEKVDIPEFGEPIRGKVRDIWKVEKDGEPLRVMVTTDRQSAFDRIVGTVPEKGRVLNLFSAYWFDKTSDIIPNQVIAVPHPNVTIAREATETVPIEVVVRSYMARSSTTTSVYHNYQDLGRRNIYGIDFPDGLRPNERFPMGAIVTPTTKSDEHDEELGDIDAKDIVDELFGEGVWGTVKNASRRLFERAGQESMSRGLILVDTKYEFGFDKNGQLMLIDEVHSPDSSRYWLADTYAERFNNGETPDTFDKEILRRWLVDHNFKGDGPVPLINPDVMSEMADAYKIPYRMITGQELPKLPESSSEQIRHSVLTFLKAQPALFS